jgi:hypothetical protein
VKIAMLQLNINICQPGLDAAGVSEYILFVDRVFFGLDSCQPVFSRIWANTIGCSNLL